MQKNTLPFDRFIIPLLMGLVLLPQSVVVPKAVAGDGKWQSHSSVAIHAGDGQERYQASLFTPLLQSDSSLLFVNLQGQSVASEQRGAGLGLGYRHLFSDWILGGWGYFDWAHTANNNDLSRFNFGVEALTEEWDLRFNGYIPASDTGRLPGKDFVELTRNSIAVRLGEEKALTGADFELGYRLPLSAPLLQDTRVFAGGWYFDANAIEAFSGSQVRVETRIHDLDLLGPGSRLTFGAEVNKESSGDTISTGFLRLRFALGNSRSTPPSSLSVLERRMTDAVSREVTVSRREGLSDPVQAYNPVTGRAVSGLVYLDAADNNAIHTRVLAAASDTWFVVDGPVQNNESIVVREGQAFIGAGMPVSVNYFEPGGGLSQLSIVPQGQPGSVLGTNAANDVFKVPANANAANVFRNLAISGGLDGISDPDTGANSSSIYANNISIENVAGRGIDLDDIGSLELHHVNISNTGTDGIFAGSENQLQIFNSSIDATGQESLQIANRNHVLIEESVFSSSTGQEGIQTGHDNYVELRRFQINDPGGDGIRFQDRNTLVLNDVTITDASDGIQFDLENTATMNGLVIINASDDGIDLAEDNNFIVLNDSLIDITGSEGIDLDAVGNTAIINGTLISNTGGSGIRLGDFTTFEFTASEINTTGQEGIIAGPTATASDNTISIIDSLITQTGREGVAIGNDSSVTLENVDIANVGQASGQEAIQLLSGNSVSLTSVFIDGTTNDGIRVTGTAGANTLDFNGVTINNVTGDAIQIDANNIANFNSLSINNSGSAGINLNSDSNSLDLRSSFLSGIGSDVILINGDNNALDGTANTASGAIGGSFCNVVGAGTTGSIAFDDVAGGGAGTCP